MNMVLPEGHAETRGGMIIGYATNAKKASVKSAAVCAADFLRCVHSGCMAEFETFSPNQPHKQ